MLEEKRCWLFGFISSTDQYTNTEQKMEHRPKDMEKRYAEQTCTFCFVLDVTFSALMCQGQTLVDGF